MKLLISLLCVFVTTQAQPIVNTTQGQVQGVNATDGNYFAFYGIHYAGYTSGDRFKAPSPPQSYPGVFHAEQDDIICAQPSPNGIIGTEDCLVLNIFTKNLTAQQPVVVYLNGEEYTNTDTTLHSNRLLVQEDLVVVKVNYRLSIFGFLCLRVEEAPGNAGLKDVIQALKWIKENIAGFGGDPNNVVLLGHGSGAAMADLITLSPLSQNLTHKAIVLSGSALSPWAVAYDPIANAESFASKLSFTGMNRQHLAQRLASANIEVINAELSQFAVFTNNTLLFAPCIEDSQLNPNNTFLAKAPIDLIRSGDYNHIPYLAGYVNREGSQRAAQAAIGNWLSMMQNNFTAFLPVDLGFESDSIKANVSQRIRQFYFASRTIDTSTIEDFLDYQGDILVLVSMIRAARERAATSSQAVRLFEFSYKGTNTPWQWPQVPLNGVRHGGILNYVFDFDLKPDDEIPKQNLVRRLATFAKSGVPSFSVGTADNWGAITNSSLNYYLFSGGEGPAANTATVFNQEPRIDPHQQRMVFWNSILETHYRAPTFSSASNVFSFAIVVLLCQFFLRLF